tara:strand:+ start:10647 stop:11828 length:1182 start_codon:yes stop_codon:yes gene_type:complete
MKTKLEYQQDVAELNKLICEKYWLRKGNEQNKFVHTCKELEQVFGLKHKDIFKIVKESAYLVIFDCQCIDCDITKICHTRSEFNQLKIDAWRCDTCWKLLQKRKKHLEIEGVEYDKKQALLIHTNNYKASQLAKVPLLDEIDVIDSLLLAAVIESLGSQDLKTTVSIDSKLLLPLSPFFILDEKILQHLFNSNLLIPNIEESSDHFSLDKQQELRIDYYRATFSFAYDSDSLIKVLTSAKTKNNIDVLVSSNNFRNWCQSIQLVECFNYLVNRSKLNNLAPCITEKLISLLMSCLASSSVSEIFYIIWRAVESAAAYSQKLGVTKKEASDTIYSNIKHNHGKISNGNWKGRGFRRDSNSPQSAISIIFFDYVFGISDCGFNFTFDELIGNATA